MGRLQMKLNLATLDAKGAAVDIKTTSGPVLQDTSWNAMGGVLDTVGDAGAIVQIIVQAVPPSPDGGLSCFSVDDATLVQAPR